MKRASKRKTDEKPSPLSKASTKLEEVTWIHTIKNFDWYGDIFNSPKGRPKSNCGGIIGLIFFVIVVVTILLNMMRLAEERVFTSGDAIHLSHIPHTFKKNGLSSVEGYQVDFPVMDLDVVNHVYFFEAEKPSVQKITVVDNTGYSRSYSSSVADPPVTASVYSKFTVPFGSMDERGLSREYPSVDLSSEDLYRAQLPAQFANYAQTTLQLFEMEHAVSNSTFTPHKASMYVRFNQDQLQQVLDYQLDIAFYNKGEFAALKEVDKLTSLASGFALWDITQKRPFNVLALKSKLSRAVSSPVSLMNWEMKAQYSYNFNETVFDFFCYDSTGFVPQSYVPIGYASSPSNTDNTLTVMGTLPDEFKVQTPFTVIGWNRAMSEKFTVTAVAGNVLTVQRTQRLDFNTMDRESGCLDQPYSSFMQHLKIPSAWTCPDYWYNDEWCDCNCGTIDIDCAFCSVPQDNCTDHAVRWPAIALGVACGTNQTSLLPGDSVLSGVFAKSPNVTSQVIKQCPEDSWYYGGSGVMFSNGSIYCNVKPTLLIYKEPMFFWTVYDEIVPAIYAREFEATLTIGINSFNVLATVNQAGGNSYVDIRGAPNSTDCEEKPSIPSYSYGTLRTLITHGDSTFLFEPIDTQGEVLYLPPEGPYQVTIDGYQVTVQYATCPRSDAQQLVVLASPAPRELVEAIKPYATIGGVMTTGFQGEVRILVSIAPSVVAIHCCERKGILVAIGTGANAYVYVVNSMSDTTGFSCCESNACGNEQPFFLNLAQPLYITTFVGTKVEVIIKGFDCANPTNYFLPYVLAVPRLEGKATSKANELVYNVAERYKLFPVPDLDLEVAMFIVPDKDDFEALVAMCSGVNPSTRPAQNQNPLYSLKRENTAKECKFVTPDITDETLCQVVDCKTKEIFPTKKFMFDYNVPVNEKWNEPEKDVDRVNTPEYVIDVSTAYYFDYSEIDVENGRAFAENTPSTGDTDQEYRPLKFSGEIDFIGYQASNDPEVQLYPANAPMLNFEVKIKPNKEATENLLSTLKLSQVKGWETKNVVDNFGPITLTWPGALPLNFIPGHNYTFAANIVLQPIYDIGLLGGATIATWTNSTTTSFTVTEGDFKSRNVANVRLLITFDSTAKTLANQKMYNLFDFFLALGSAIALLNYGYVILIMWQVAADPVNIPEDQDPPCSQPKSLLQKLVTRLKNSKLSKYFEACCGCCKKTGDEAENSTENTTPAVDKKKGSRPRTETGASLIARQEDERDSTSPGVTVELGESSGDAADIELAGK